MNKTRLILRGVLVAVLASALFSCVKENREPEQDGAQYVTISAFLGSDQQDTKTYLTGSRVKWEATDSIALWYGTLGTGMDGEPYTVLSIDATDARKATFRGFAPARDCYMGVYPYSASDDCSKKGKLTVTLPTTQLATAGSFGPGANVAVACSETTDLAFKNVGGLMAFGLTDVGGHTITSVRLEGTAPLSGQVEIKQADLPAITTITSGVNYVDLVGSFAEKNTYYFVVLPGAHTGFTLTFTDSRGYTATATSSYAFEIERRSNSFIADITIPEDRWVAPVVVLEEKVVLNELQGNGQKYIELYNAGEGTVSLAGWTLVKDEESPAKWTGTTESLDPGEYLVLYSSKNKNADANPDGAIIFDAGLSAKKNVQVVLKNASGEVKDTFQRGEKGSGWGDITLAENVAASFSRVPNGTGDWKYAAPTCGAVNGEKTGTIEQYPAANGSVILNELNGNDKFIELRSTATDQKISLEEMTIQKDGKLVWTGAQGYAIEPGGYVLLYSTDVIGSHPEHDTKLTFSSGLSAKKVVRVQLFGANGTSLDDFNYASYSGTPAPASYGRNADGVWYYQTATPGTVNTDGTDIVTGLAPAPDPAPSPDPGSGPVMGATWKADILTGEAAIVEEISGVCLSQGGDFLWGAGDNGALWKIVPGDGTAMATLQISGDGEKDLEGITIDPSTGDLYLGGEPGSVFKCASASSYASVSPLFDVAPAAELSNKGIEGIAWYRGDLYLGAQNAATLWQYALDGTQLMAGVSLTTKAPALTEIAGLCYDPVSDRLWVVDSKALTLFVFKGDLSVLEASYYIGGFATENPEGICVDRANGCVWIVEDSSAGKASVLHKVLFENL